eukprot:354953_1
MAVNSAKEDEQYEQLLTRITELEAKNEKIQAENERWKSIYDKSGEFGSQQVHESIAADVKKYITHSKIDEFQKLIQQNKITANDTLLVKKDEFFCDDLMKEDTNLSLLEYAALLGKYEVCSLLLNLGVEVTEKDAERIGLKLMESGNIHIAILLQSVHVSGAGGTEVEDNLSKLDKQNGCMKTFLLLLSKNENMKMFINIMETNIIHCIKNEIGFSDDFLNLLYHYY